MTIKAGDVLFTGTPQGVILGEKVPRERPTPTRLSQKLYSSAKRGMLRATRTAFSTGAVSAAAPLKVGPQVSEGNAGLSQRGEQLAVSSKINILAHCAST
nr:hypothetical protein [Bradyrhizobium elkanii]